MRAIMAHFTRLVHNNFFEMSLIQFHEKHIKQFV